MAQLVDCRGIGVKDRSPSEFTDGIMRSDPARVAKFLALGAGSAEPWWPQELRASLAYELNKPVFSDLARADIHSPDCVTPLAVAQSFTVNSIADLFVHACPSLALLKGVKEFAKANHEHPESTIPPAVARTLYYASIAAALARHQTRISGLSDQQLREGLDWTRRQEWFDQRLSLLFEEALRCLSA